MSSVLLRYSPDEIQDTPEFYRVLNLPRRDWEEEAKRNDLYLRMTTAFKLPRGEQTLRLIQASALADAHDKRGLLGAMRVGAGKTLTSFLLPVVILGIQRPCLLVPASLLRQDSRDEGKTWREFKELHGHWLCHPAFSTESQFEKHTISYERLSRDSGKDALNALRPDLIIADEVHNLRNRTAACTKRFERYMLANPETVFCGVSGTITKRSIRDYWHLLYYALRQHMPLPQIEVEMEKWAEVLDERRIDPLSRRAPGALMQFCTEEERAKANPPRTVPKGRTQQMPTFNFGEKLAMARQGYQRRLRETPGVVCSPEKNLDCSLVVRRVRVDPGPQMLQYFDRLRQKPWTTPNGDILSTPMDVWRVARELACGFCYRWSPPPPKEWLAARGTWNFFVGEILQPDGKLHDQYKHLHLDSAFQVAQAVVGRKKHIQESPYVENLREDEYDSEGDMLEPSVVALPAMEILSPTITDPAIQEAYRNWANIRGSYKINTVAEWYSTAMLDYCVEWAKKAGSGIIWVEHRAFGERLAEMLGTGFCSNGGLDKNGKAIELYAREKKTVVASVAANKVGRNLQAYNKNLLVTITPVGWIMEQVLGRTHREGQEADTVYVDWVSACDEQESGFYQMLADAQYIEQTTGQSQKLLYADKVY